MNCPPDGSISWGLRPCACCSWCNTKWPSREASTHGLSSLGRLGALLATSFMLAHIVSAPLSISQL